MTRRKLFFFVTEDWYFVSHRLPLALAAQHAGYDVSVVTRVREHGDTIRAAGLRLIPLEVRRGSMNPVRDVALLFRLVRLYRREAPDILHHVALKPVLYGSIAAWVLRDAHVINALAGLGWLRAESSGLHAAIKPLVRGLMGRVLQRGLTLVQNPDDEADVRKLGIPGARIRRIVGSGVDLAIFNPAPDPAGDPVIVLPGRLLWEKGVAEFVEAARLLRQQDLAVEFVLAGATDPANPSSVPEEAVAGWTKEGIVRHLGWVSNMNEVYARSHIVCLPSYAEGAPKALMEAAAAGRPIVTTDTRGCRDLVRHGDNGLLVPPRDAVALAGAIALLATDASLRRRMGQRGRARAQEEFAVERIVSATLALYQEGST